MDKKIEIAKRLGLYYDRISPQIKDGSLQYYISGSLASMILGNAEEIVELELDKDNHIIGEKEPKKITDEQRAKIQTFSRKLGIDVDVVNVNGNLFYGASIENRPSIPNVVKNVEDVMELNSWRPTFCGSMYIDALEGDRDITTHSVVKVKTDEGELLVTAPPELLAFKMTEMIFIGTKILNNKANDDYKKKYEKDVKDLSTLFYGFYELYGEEFIERIFTVLINHKYFRISQNNIMEEQEFYEQRIFKKIKEDCMSLLMDIAGVKTAMDFEVLIDKLLEKRRVLAEEKQAGNHIEI